MKLAQEFSLKEGTDFMQSSTDKIRVSFKLEPVSVSWGQSRERAVCPRVPWRPPKGTGACQDEAFMLGEMGSFFRNIGLFLSSLSPHPCSGSPYPPIWLNYPSRAPFGLMGWNELASSYCFGPDHSEM